jgi:hypothetical protein
VKFSYFLPCFFAEKYFIVAVCLRKNLFYRKFWRKIMAGANLSPIEKILEKRKEARKLPAKIYEKIFDFGVHKTAEMFGIKSEEAVKLIIKTARKAGETDKLQDLSDRKKISKICERIIEMNTFSTGKIYEECKDFAEIWEIVISKRILKTRQEYTENG